MGGSIRWATPAMLLLSAGMCYVAVSNYVTKELGRGAWASFCVCCKRGG